MDNGESLNIDSADVLKVNLKDVVTLDEAISKSYLGIDLEDYYISEQKKSKIEYDYMRMWHTKTPYCVFTNDDEKNKEASNLCKRYAQKYKENFENNHSLLLMGHLGTGKTFYAKAILNYIIAQSIEDNYGIGLVKAYTMPDIINAMQDFSNPKAKTDILYAMRTSSFILIDDFGAERDTDFVNEQIYSVINKRYESKKPMIITTNMSPDEFKGTDDLNLNRAYDRIKEMCITVPVQGESRRIDIHKEKNKDYWK